MALAGMQTVAMPHMQQHRIIFFITVYFQVEFIFQMSLISQAI